jgi:hypothetical protein
VGEQHLRIDFDGSTWTLTDLGSVNPTLHNARTCSSSSAALASGDVLRLGGTTLRVFSPDHPVETPVQIQKASPLFAWLMKPLNVWAFFALAVALSVAFTYTSVWSEETRLMLAGAGAGTAVSLLVWAALWSVAGKLIRRRSCFRAHLALISLFVACSILSAWASEALSFLDSEGLPAALAGYALGACLLVFLIYGSLALATQIGRGRRLAASAFFALSLGFGVFTVDLIASEKFSSDPLYPYLLVPYLDAAAPARTLDQFIGKGAKVFGSDTFSHEQKDAQARDGASRSS